MRGKADHPAREIIYVTEVFLFSVCLAGAVAFADTPAGVGKQSLKGTLGGIPMHRFAIDTAAHSEVGIKVDGRIDEPVWARTPYYDNMIVAVPVPASLPSTKQRFV